MPEGIATTGSYSHWPKIAIAAVAFLPGCWLRLRGLGVPTFWLDEFVSLWIVEAPGPAELWERCSSVAATPPGYFFLLQLHLSFWGNLSEWQLRIPSVLFDIAAAGLLFSWVWKEIGFHAGLISLLLYSSNTTLVYQARICRPYSLAMFFAVGACWSLYAAVHSRKRACWIAYAILASALMYTQFVFAPLLVAQFIFCLVRSERRHLIPVIISFASIGVACLPLGWQLVRLLEQRQLLAWANGESDLARVAALFQPASALSTVTVICLWCLWRKQTLPMPDGRGFGGYQLAVFGLGSCAIWAASLAAGATLLESRYLVVYLIPVIALTAWLLASLPPRLRWIATVVFLVTGNSFRAQVSEVYHQGYATLVTYDYRPSLDKLNRECQPDDVLFIRTGLVESQLLGSSGSPDLLRGYLSCPIHSLYLEIDPSTRPVADHWTARDLDRRFGMQVREAAGRGLSVWFLCHDGYGGKGNRVYASFDQWMTMLGWQGTAELLSGELLVRYSKGATN